MLAIIAMDHPTADAERARLVEALAGVAAGDRAAFREVYARTSAKLLGVVLRIFPERDEAEDVLQEVYLSIWRKAGQFDPARASPITWLVTMARNRAIDRLRAQNRTITTTIDAGPDLPDHSPGALDRLISCEGDARVVFCLGQLPGGDAELIQTAFFQGSTYADLAARAAIPLGTVKSRMRRALLKLRDCLQ